jgi:hypothetical protein
MIEAVASTAWYVYAFVAPCSADVRTAVENMHGVGTGALRVVGGEHLCAVVGSVPLAEFGEEALPERLNDRAWLEDKARTHEEVLERLLDVTTVIPLRFGSIFEDLAAVEEMLGRRRANLEHVLTRVRGRVEVGVQAWLDRAAFAAEPAVEAISGRAYLERKRDERRRTDEAAGELQQLLGDVHERLLGLATDGVVNRPQPRELTGREAEMAFNAAYLVPAGDESLARAVVELDAVHREQGLSFNVTGPWPPHNFVDVEDDE